MTNYIAIARRLRGLTAVELAARLGVSKQQVSNWEHGVRLPSRESAEELARALDVSAAWIMGLSMALPVSADLETIYSCPIIREEVIPEYGTLYHVYLDETGDIVPVILSAGVQFVPRDWQTLYTHSAAEIPETDWQTAGGVPAIMLDGLPRVFA